MDTNEIDQISKKIIGCAFTVGNRLGCGFLAKIYQNALVIEMRKAGLNMAQQQVMRFFTTGVLSQPTWQT